MIGCRAPTSQWCPKLRHGPIITSNTWTSIVRAMNCSLLNNDVISLRILEVEKRGAPLTVVLENVLVGTKLQLSFHGFLQNVRTQDLDHMFARNTYLQFEASFRHSNFAHIFLRQRSTLTEWYLLRLL